MMMMLMMTMTMVMKKNMMMKKNVRDIHINDYDNKDCGDNSDDDKGIVHVIINIVLIVTMMVVETY